jgi:hypothetical protein
MRRKNAMKTTTKTTTLVCAIACTLGAGASCRSNSEGATPASDRVAAPTSDDFTRGMHEYLDRRGDLCVGRPRWPIDVPEGERFGADAGQLPVLERLGVVTSTVISERQGGVATPFQVRRYRLTAEGRAHYLDRQTRLPASLEDSRAGVHADFCVLKLSLGKVTKWEMEKGAKPPAATVSYTYGVDAPAWVRDPAFQRAFPAVAHLVAGAGAAELVERFTLAPGGWTANQLLPRAEPAGSPPQAAAP